MELTREIIESIKRNGECEVCGNKTIEGDLARRLLSEIDKPKGITHTTEKEQSVKRGEFLRDVVCEKSGGFTEKNRELVSLAWDACLASNGIAVTPPKSRIDEIAEEYSEKSGHGSQGIKEIIKSAILRALEEKESNR